VLNGILFFIKDPVPGQVKTRLAATVGAQRAAENYRELAEKRLRQSPWRFGGDCRF
jgi:glycosyltransferase A (GT-A) superfamily protein (DUF2064 family)